MGLDLVGLLPAPWRERMASHLDPDLASELSRFVEDEYAQHVVYPPIGDLYAAFRLCPPDQARVLILGQDPYHGPGQAHGLCFSVRAGVAIPPSLRNILAELREDVGVQRSSGDLTAWAEQGVLLLNTILTVRAGEAGSHARRGWEHVTDAAIRALDESPHRVVFLLWGTHARKKATLITGAKHAIFEAGHPSPMNAKGFRGSRPFSACNEALREAGLPPINWS